jgi:hypothetical protein
VDLVEVEVLQAQAVSREELGHGIRGGHEQALVAVDVVDRGGGRIDEAGQQGQAVLPRPLLGGKQHHAGAVGQGGGVAGRHGGALALTEDRREAGELLDGGVGAQVLVAGQAEVGREQVVEEAAVVGRRELVVAGGGKLVLGLAGDAPVGRGQGLVLTHGQAGARLGVARDLGDDLAGAQAGQGLDPVAEAAGPVGLQQRPAQPFVDRDRRVAGGVDASGDAALHLAEGDLVGDEDRGLQAGAAGLLHVIGRRPGRQVRAEDGLAGQVEVTAVLEHRAGSDLADLLPGEAAAGHQAVNGGGEHVLVRRVGVGAVLAGERDAVGADHVDRAGGLQGQGSSSCHGVRAPETY